MRNLIIGAVAAAALLGAPVAAGAATADPPWTPVTNPLNNPTPGAPPNSPITLPAGRNCAFAVDIAVVTNNEFEQVTTLADKDTVTKIRGNLVLSFKNDTSGKTLDEQVSGPTTETDSPDGTSGTFQGEGPNWFAFGPHGQANTGEPGLVFTKGRVITTFANGATQTFSLNGTQQNGCALLS
jgi:hypothetical protein